MKLIKILTIGLSILLVISCSKSEAEDKTEAPDGSESAAVALPTLQCGMCKKIIEKGLTDIEGVVSIDVNIEKKNATVVYRAGLIDLARIEKAIAGLGYKANETTADPAVYADLAKCCKLRAVRPD